MNEPRIVYLTAGAGGMFCGSCMHDNALARALSQHGFDVQLVPTYTPIRTDETDFSVDQVFFGGINVYLQQKFPPLRWLPAFLDRFLDHPSLIRRITSRTIDLPPAELGRLALSMLKGIQGNQRKEVRRLCDWLKHTARPDVIVFTNMLIGGCIPEIKRFLDVPVIVTLQGDDVFLESLPAEHRAKCIAAIQELVPLVDGFIVHSNFYRLFMQDYFAIPSDEIQVTPLGIDVSEFALAGAGDNAVPTIGYLARLSPEKGLHHLVDAFLEIKRSGAVSGLRLRVAGWLGKADEPFAAEQFERIANAGFGDDFEYIGSIERQEKMEFLSTLTVLSVPTQFLEPKGLYVLEANAAGVPVVQPRHGCFPELVGHTGGGLLFEPGNLRDYSEKLIQLLSNEQHRNQLAENGRQHVHENRSSTQMAKSTAEVISFHLPATKV